MFCDLAGLPRALCVRGGSHVFITAFLLVLAGCSALPSLEERRAHADALAAAKSWQPISISTPSFKLLAYGPPSFRSEVSALTVYIEGDGLAWVTASQPSDDPTPREPVALQLALAQPGGYAAYLARPCQYTMAKNSPGPSCSRRYWTGARFSEPVIQAESQALDELKRRYGADRLVLVGYSGGGAVAALLASRRNDVIGLVTVAGNIDHAAWTRHHQVPALRESLNPIDDARTLTLMPQVHFIGENDTVVPPAIAYAYAARSGSDKLVKVVQVAGFAHACCWAQRWPILWTELEWNR